MPTDPRESETNAGPAANRGGEGGGHARPSPAPPVRDLGLGRELGGDLPCVACGYNLRGLSIRSMCPECGAAVRATILSVVDPQASELRPIRWPRLTAAGVVLWAFGAVAVVMMSWLPQAADVLRMLGFRGIGRPSAALGVELGLGTSMLGSLALIRPHAGVPRAGSLMAAAATLLYVPLGWALWKYHTAMDAMGGQRYLSGWSPTPETSHALALACAIIATIIMLQRPNARILVARSMVLRTGRVDRQTMYAMAIAACIMGLGALMGLVGLDGVGQQRLMGEVARSIGVVMLAFGGVLVSIGALGSMLDCVRIAGAILIPKATLRQVIREGRPASASRIMRMIDPTPPPSIARPPTPAQPRKPGA